MSKAKIYSRIMQSDHSTSDQKYLKYFLDFKNYSFVREIKGFGTAKKAVLNGGKTAYEFDYLKLKQTKNLGLKD